MRLAIPLVLASQLTAPSAVPAWKTGTVIGRVLPTQDGRRPAKAVWIGGVSSPLDAAGWFKAASVPAGPTQVLVETEEGMYAVESPVTVAPGVTRSLQLALGAREDTSDPPPSDKEKKKKSSGVWADPASATLIIIGSAILLGVVVDELVMSDDEASPFQPSASTHH